MLVLQKMSVQPLIKVLVFKKTDMSDLLNDQRWFSGNGGGGGGGGGGKGGGGGCQCCWELQNMEEADCVLCCMAG